MFNFSKDSLKFAAVLFAAWYFFGGMLEGFCEYPVRRPWSDYTYPGWKCPQQWWPLFHWFNEKPPNHGHY